MFNKICFIFSFGNEQLNLHFNMQRDQKTVFRSILGGKISFFQVQTMCKEWDRRSCLCAEQQA